MRRVLLDTAVVVYALGREHPYREPCRAIMGRIRDGDLIASASVELVHELAHFLLRRGLPRSLALRHARDAAEMCDLHDFERRDLPLALTLLAEHERLDVRDAVFAATALNRGIDGILSPDRAFDAVPGLDRIDPADAAAVAAL